MSFMNSSTVISVSRRNFLSNPFPKTLWLGIEIGVLDASDKCFIRI